MATPESYYCNTTDRDHLQTTPTRARNGVSIVNKSGSKVPQLAMTNSSLRNQRQYGSAMPTEPSKAYESMQHLSPTYSYAADRSVVINWSTTSSTDHRMVTGGQPSRSDTLKRRSSLREAARFIRAPRVTKRLRRQAKADFHTEDGDDAGASASESDHSGQPSYLHKPDYLQTPFVQPPRPQSAVSNLASGIESSLTIEPSSRSRGSSMASQTSAFTVSTCDSASTNTSFTTLSSFSDNSLALEPDYRTELEEEEDSDQSRAPTGVSGPSAHEQSQLFACPFAKHDPQRYSAANLEELHYRGCSQSYLTDLARVKQHLYRVHERPQHYCNKCFEVFKTQAQCNKHIALQSCTPRPFPFGEKMTPEQLTAIKKKNRGTDPHNGWYDIYKTLFPSAQIPMSPYAAFAATVDTLESFMEFVVRELPTRLQHGDLPDVLRDIRRDFGRATHGQIHSAVAKPAETETGKGGQTEKPSDEVNYYRMVSLDVRQPDQRYMAYGSAGLMPTDVYGYESIPPSLSGPRSDRSPPPYQYQQPQPSTNLACLEGRRMNYDILGHGHNRHINQALLSGIGTEPLTAIFQPDEQDAPDGYFTGHHSSQNLLPASLLRIEQEDSGIPTMISMTLDHSMHNHSVYGSAGEFYQGFNRHHFN